MKTTLKADLGYAQIMFPQQLTRMSYPQLQQKPGVGFAAAAFKIPTERVGTDISHFRHVLDADFLLKMSK